MKLILTNWALLTILFFQVFQQVGYNIKYKSDICNHDCTSFHHISSFGFILHGPSMFAVKAKIYGVLYIQASSIAFDETSSYWSALKSS